MRKPVRNLLLGAGAAAVGVACLAILFARRTGPDPRKVLESLAQAPPSHRLAIEYPLDGTLFPLEIVAPTFRWKDDVPQSDLWLVTIEFANGGRRINRFAQRPEWSC